MNSKKTTTDRQLSAVLAGAVPAGVEATYTHLELPADLPFEAWVDIGDRLHVMSNAIQFCIGDWAAFGEAKYGARRYEEAAAKTGYVLHSVQSMVSVCRSVPPAIRRQSLTWSHHREVAALDTDLQDILLGRAEKEGWSVADIRSAAKELTGRTSDEPEEREHTRIQWLLLKLGAAWNYELWVAPDDRRRSFAGNTFADLPGLWRELPRQFADEQAHKVVRRIDVLWLRRGNISHAFEIENTTAIYSGLLRMSDLITLVPQLPVLLYIVAPHRRYDKVLEEITRPTFREHKLPAKCRIIEFEKLQEAFEKYGDISKHLKDSFLDEISDSCDVIESSSFDRL